MPIYTMRAVIIIFILFVIWLLLSGHFNALLLSLGLFSCVFITWLSFRLALFHDDSSTLAFSLRLPKFLPWFFIEVFKANLDVSWRILHPKLPIEPNIITLPVAQHNNIGKAVYANCITLTPGTYTLEMNAESIEVHTLSKQGAQELQDGEMSNRILSLESRFKQSMSE